MHNTRKRDFISLAFRILDLVVTCPVIVMPAFFLYRPHVTEASTALSFYRKIKKEYLTYKVSEDANA